MSESFTLRTEDAAGEVTVVRVGGHLDAKSAPKLIGASEAVATNGRDLVLVLSEISFISSTGIGSLLVITEKFRECGRQVRFANLSTTAESAVKLLNLDNFLAIDPTEDASLSALGTRAA